MTVILVALSGVVACGSVQSKGVSTPCTQLDELNRSRVARRAGAEDPEYLAAVDRCVEFRRSSPRPFDRRPRGRWNQGMGAGAAIALPGGLVLGGLGLATALSCNCDSNDLGCRDECEEPMANLPPELLIGSVVSVAVGLTVYWISAATR